MANLEQPTVERRREKDGDIFLVLWRRKGITSRKDKKIIIYNIIYVDNK